MAYCLQFQNSMTAIFKRKAQNNAEQPAPILIKDNANTVEQNQTKEIVIPPRVETSISSEADTQLLARLRGGSASSQRCVK